MRFAKKSPSVIVCFAVKEVGIFPVGVEVLLRTSCVAVEDLHCLVEKSLHKRLTNSNTTQQQPLTLQIWEQLTLNLHHKFNIKTKTIIFITILL